MTASALIDRALTATVQRSLEIHGVVILEGPRACGKSTLLGLLREAGALSTIIDLADPVARQAAAVDPVGFIEGLSGSVGIDEAQLVPGLALAVKRAVDRPQGWGPAVLTGSSPVGRGELGGTEPLVGRAVHHQLRPLTRREIAGRPDSLMPALFDRDHTGFPAASGERPWYLEHALRSGFPAARHLDVADATEWISRSYVGGVIPSGLTTEGNRLSPRLLTQVLRHLAASASNELVHSRLAQQLEIARPTATSHVQLLADLGLIELLPGWRPGSAKRHVARPKIHVADGGLLAWAIAGEPTDVERGAIFESLVVRELRTQADAWPYHADFHHWRSPNYEVDIIISDGDRCLAIEVKSSRSLPKNALRGIDAFAHRYPDRFHRGIVFYAGDATVPLGPHRIAIPISALWETPAPVA